MTEEIALSLKLPMALAPSLIIFKPAAEYPNSPETTIKSPGAAPFRDGIWPLSENPIILQSITNSLDWFVSPPTNITPNSLEDILKPFANPKISFLEYLVGIPIEIKDT